MQTALEDHEPEPDGSDARSNQTLLLTSGLSDCAGTLRSLALRYDSLAAELQALAGRTD
jgi:hypothetical protein